MKTPEQRKIDNALYYSRKIFNVKLYRRFVKLMEIKGYDLPTIRDACYLAAENGIFSLQK